MSPASSAASAVSPSRRPAPSTGTAWDLDERVHLECGERAVEEGKK